MQIRKSYMEVVFWIEVANVTMQHQYLALNESQPFKYISTNCGSENRELLLFTLFPHVKSSLYLIQGTVKNLTIRSSWRCNGVQKEWTISHFLVLSKNSLQSKYSCVFFYILKLYYIPLVWTNMGESCGLEEVFVLKAIFST